VQSGAHDESQTSGKVRDLQCSGHNLSGKKRFCEINCESRRIGEHLATIQGERSHHVAKFGPWFSARPDAGYEFFCRTCRRAILCYSGTRSSRLTRRRPGWLGHLDSASPERVALLPRAPRQLLHPSNACCTSCTLRTLSIWTTNFTPH